MEWHLAAETPEPAERVEFVTVIRPHRKDETPPTGARLHEVPNGYVLEAELAPGRVLVLMRAAQKGQLRFKDVAADADLAAVRFGTDGKPAHSLLVRGRNVQAGPGGDLLGLP